MGQTARWFDGTIGTTSATTTWQLELPEFLRTQSWRRVVIQVLVRTVTWPGGTGSISPTWQGCVQADPKFLYPITQSGSPFTTDLGVSSTNTVLDPVRIEWGSATATGKKDGLAGFLGFSAAAPGALGAWSANLEIWVLLSDPV